MKELSLIIDKNSQVISGIDVPSTTYNIVLSGESKTITVPESARFIMYSATGNFFASDDVTAEWPDVDVTDGTGVEINPGLRTCEPGDLVRIGTQEDIVIQVSFFGRG